MLTVDTCCVVQADLGRPRFEGVVYDMEVTAGGTQMLCVVV